MAHAAPVHCVLNKPLGICLLFLVLIRSVQRKSIGYVLNMAFMVILPVVPHKAVAEVSKIGNLSERLVVVNQGWQSEATDGPKGA